MTDTLALPFPIQTPRLSLREMERPDTEQLQIYHMDAEFRQYEDPDDVYGETFAELMESLLAERWRVPRRSFYLAITRNEWPSVAMGSIFVAIDEVHTGEIGYVMGKPYWGQGYATESAQAMLNFAFKTLRLQRVYAECHCENIASKRVLEKAGMRHERVLSDHQFMRGRWWDTWVYGIRKPDWLVLYDTS